ncbi:type VI immunity family protein, partial [Salmonella enterica]|uniref:type VI immunity family protein n=2 Tax=Pseudomonadota TaxID=1224 RepID=UPI003CE7CF41
VGFTASFFFWGGHTGTKRTAVVECIEAFEALYGQHLEWALNEDTGRWEKLSSKKYLSARQQAERMDENDSLSIYLCSGEDHQAVSEY